MLLSLFKRATSVPDHRLSQDDQQALRCHFPAASALCLKLSWSPWKDLWSDDFRGRLANLLGEDGTKPDKKITLESYQRLAGQVVRGSADDRAQCIISLFGVGCDARKSDSIQTSSMMELVADVAAAFIKLHHGQLRSEHEDTCAIFAKSMLLSSFASTEKPDKHNVLHLVPDSTVNLSVDDVERWLVSQCPLFDQMFVLAMAHSYMLPPAPLPTLIPLADLQLSEPTNSQLSALDVAFLNHQLPPGHQHRWRAIFNSKRDGESFAKFSRAILSQGPTFLIVWEASDEGHIFGGFASTSWRIGPHFFGDNACFLFSLKPRMLVFESTPFNQNFLYLNDKQKTMPNGLGMGGQLEYFGLWLDSEYGQGQCAPSCSTYRSPPLSRDKSFHYSHLEVWGVGDQPLSADDEDGGSVLDRDPEAQAILEMMGKRLVSKDVRAAAEKPR